MIHKSGGPLRHKAGPLPVSRHHITLHLGEHLSDGACAEGGHFLIFSIKKNAKVRQAELSTVMLYPFGEKTVVAHHCHGYYLLQWHVMYCFFEVKDATSQFASTNLIKKLTGFYNFAEKTPINGQFTNINP